VRMYLPRLLADAPRGLADGFTARGPFAAAVAAARAAVRPAHAVCPAPAVSPTPAVGPAPARGPTPTVRSILLCGVRSTPRWAVRASLLLPGSCHLRHLPLPLLREPATWRKRGPLGDYAWEAPRGGQELRRFKGDREVGHERCLLARAAGRVRVEQRFLLSPQRADASLRKGLREVPHLRPSRRANV
jgi:hypothetical protein